MVTLIILFIVVIGLSSVKKLVFDDNLVWNTKQLKIQKSIRFVYVMTFIVVLVVFVTKFAIPYYSGKEFFSSDGIGSPTLWIGFFIGVAFSLTVDYLIKKNKDKISMWLLPKEIRVGKKVELKITDSYDFLFGEILIKGKGSGIFYYFDRHTPDVKKDDVLEYVVKCINVPLKKIYLAKA